MGIYKGNRCPDPSALRVLVKDSLHLLSYAHSQAELACLLWATGPEPCERNDRRRPYMPDLSDLPDRNALKRMLRHFCWMDHDPGRELALHWDVATHKWRCVCLGGLNIPELSSGKAYYDTLGEALMVLNAGEDSVFLFMYEVLQWLGLDKTV